MYVVSRTATLTGTYEDLAVTGGVCTLMGYANGTTQVKPGATLVVNGYLNGGALVDRNGLLIINGYVTFGHHSFLEGEVQIAGAVTVPPGATKLLPGGRNTLVRPGTIFNVGPTQHMVTVEGELEQLLGSNNIKIKTDVWLRYDVLTNRFKTV